MTVCLPFSKIRFLTVNPRTGYILLGFIMFIIIYCYQEFYYLNDIGTVLLAGFDKSKPAKRTVPVACPPISCYSTLSFIVYGVLRVSARFILSNLLIINGSQM